MPVANKLKTAKCLHLSHILSMGNPWNMLVYIIKRLQGKAYHKCVPCTHDMTNIGHIASAGFMKGYCEADILMTEALFNNTNLLRGHLPEVHEDITLEQAENPDLCEVKLIDVNSLHSEYVDMKLEYIDPELLGDYNE